ncbi:pilus assembly protein FimV [Burkholderia sp. Bp8963]|uniref:FimV/HubP family polar landmark protein n=1 Tax=Burkholderia sp. Bp8963 TaxID=2184547 RepID=UPI000F5A8DA4|nr:FimV/HubP family polar landmark protein [Burkholderia sp. Bp8963]RQS74373.1 pilus assembly protein FimV [Burkholderia sp. Bp8963]
MFRISLFPRQSRLAHAVRSALAVLALGTAASAWAFGASDAAATEAGSAAPLTITVQSGQSLNDLAIAVTQSHDPGVLARAGRALFDANPQAFMKRDPSRLKLGATLTVPALDATGAAVGASGAAASATAASSAAHAASAPATSSAAHAASAPHPAPNAQAVPSASAAHAAQAGEAHASAATGVAGASSAAGVSGSHGASEAGAQSAASPAGASGPHVWSGAIEAAPSSASEAATPSTHGGAPGLAAPSSAAPAAGTSQPRPSSLQQLLALKNRVLMELQKHGIGKPAATDRAAADAGRTLAPAPVTQAPAANATGAFDASSAASAAAATGEAASAAQPETPSARPAAPVAAPSTTGAASQVDWRAVSAGGAAAVVLIAGFMWRKRRKARRDAVAATTAATGASGASGASDADNVTPYAAPELPIQPETPVSRDAAADVYLAAAAAAAAEAAETHETHETHETPLEAHDTREAEASAPAVETQRDDRAAHEAVPGSADAAASQPVDAPVTPAAPAESSTPVAQPAPSVPSAADSQQAMMQSAITALNSLDMPLPPRTPGVSPAPTHDAPGSDELPVGAAFATNGQAAPRPPIDAPYPTPQSQADHEDDLEWDADVAPSGHVGAAPAAAPTLAPLGGAQFGALKLDFDLDLPAASGAVLPALTPEELVRIARNKLDLAHEYVELGDLSGARTLLEEVVDANDAATRDDARALLAKLADEA